MIKDSVGDQIYGFQCPTCGKSVSNKDIFCRHCGGNLDKLFLKPAEFTVPEPKFEGELGIKTLPTGNSQPEQSGQVSPPQEVLDRLPPPYEDFLRLASGNYNAAGQAAEGLQAVKTGLAESAAILINGQPDTGSRVPAWDQMTGLTCPDCGETISDRFRFCPYCGSILGKPVITDVGIGHPGSVFQPETQTQTHAEDDIQPELIELISTPQEQAPYQDLSEQHPFELGQGQPTPERDNSQADRGGQVNPPPQQVPFQEVSPSSTLTESIPGLGSEELSTHELDGDGAGQAELMAQVEETRPAGSEGMPVNLQPEAVVPEPASLLMPGLACPSCGKSVTEKDLFCRHCGGNLPEPISHGAVTEVQAVPTHLEEMVQSQSKEESQADPGGQPNLPVEETAFQTLNPLQEEPEKSSILSGAILSSVATNGDLGLDEVGGGSAAAAQAPADATSAFSSQAVPLAGHTAAVARSLPATVICPNCKILVWPKADGTCPSCQFQILPEEVSVSAAMLPERVGETTVNPEPELAKTPLIQGAGGVAQKTASEKAQPGSQFELCLASGETRTYGLVKDLREDILHGIVPKSLQARTVTTTPVGKRKESKWVTVEKLAVSNGFLRSLYRPTWDYTLKYISYGAIACIALKAVDTTVTLFMAGPLIGLLWLAVVGSLLLTKKWPAAPIVVIVASVLMGVKVNLFVAVLSTMLVGFIFGAPLGMIIGTIVGAFHKKSFHTAPDAEPEGARPFLLGILMPLAILAVLIPLYIWANMNLAQWLQ